MQQPGCRPCAETSARINRLQVVWLPRFVVLSKAAMLSLCVSCVQTNSWRSLLDGRLARLSETAPLQEVFVAEVEPRLPSCGNKSCASQLQLTVSPPLTGTAGSWKDVKLDDTVGLIVDFGCRYVRFQVATDTLAEPSANGCVSVLHMMSCLQQPTAETVFQRSARKAMPRTGC